MTARFKRSASGEITLDGERFAWSIHREPQWCTVDGWKGLALSVKHHEGKREAIVQFPMPMTRVGAPHRHRPRVSDQLITYAVSKAIEAGWEPLSRGKAVLVEVSHP